MSKEALAAELLPVSSLEAALPHLRRPFAPAAVKFKLQAAWGSGGLVVAYIDARLVIERLNAVCGAYWDETFESAGQGAIWCYLSIGPTDGRVGQRVTHSDVGTGRDLKATISDARKRAAVPFGVGVSIYALAQARLIVGNEDGQLRTREIKGKQEPTLDERTVSWLRGGYERWLVARGEEAFGPVLDHGDVEGAQGDPDEGAESGDLSGDLPDPQVQGEEADAARERAREAYARRPDRRSLLPAEFQRRLTEAGTSMEALEAFAGEMELAASVEATA